MNRGDIFFADLNPTKGSEIQKVRPVLIISNDQNNKSSDTITIIPLSSQVEKVFRFEVFLPQEISGLPKDSKALCHQIRTISKERIVENKKGRISPEIIEKVEHALLIHLGMA